MKVFDIETSFTYGQTHSVVAENISEAERIFLGRYKGTTINTIKLHSEYVKVQGIDEKQRKSD